MSPIRQGRVPASNEYWLLNLDAIESGTGQVTEYLYVHENELCSSIVQFDTENVLYSKLRPYLNKVVVSAQPGFATSELVPLKPNQEYVTREYLAYCLRSPKFVAHINGRTSGAKMPRARIADILAFDMPCPPLEQQNQVVNTLNAIVNLIDSYSALLKNYNNLAKPRFKWEVAA